MILSIEIAGPKNESVLFFGQRLRGRWDYAATMNRDKSSGHKRLALAAPVIPGIIVELDTDKKTGTVMDSLSETPEGRAVFGRISSVIEQFPIEFDGEMKPWPKAVSELSVDAVKDWAHLMVSLVNQGYARNLRPQGMPTLETIAKWPGKRLRDPNNSGRQEQELAKYTDVEPEETAMAAATAGRGK
jgi:hypothetical protein